ncbi:MAG: YdeI/OmpD-associated family protein [Pseudomonadota bacterium]
MHDEILQFDSQGAWAQWLAQHHAASSGVWVRHAKKGAPQPTVSHPQALEVALCFGWIDAIKKSEGPHYWLQRWTPRSRRSIWSKVNRASALAYVANGRMQPSGLAEVRRAQLDGRWDAAYDAVSASSIAPDLQAALDARPGAEAFFNTISSQNRYAITFRIQTAKKPETRARRIEQFADMLARRETIHPDKKA